jgi:hypothetical protein
MEAYRHLNRKAAITIAPLGPGSFGALGSHWAQRGTLSDLLWPWRLKSNRTKL